MVFQFLRKLACFHLLQILYYNLPYLIISLSTFSEIEFLFRKAFSSESHYTCAHTLDGSRWFLTNDSSPLVEVDSTHVKKNCILIFIKKGGVLIICVAFLLLLDADHIINRRKLFKILF